MRHIERRPSRSQRSQGGVATAGMSVTGRRREVPQGTSRERCRGRWGELRDPHI
ncbi:hypothetical protein KI387_003958, partial [Taxus chinensis]